MVVHEAVRIFVHHGAYIGTIAIRVRPADSRSATCRHGPAAERPNSSIERVNFIGVDIAATEREVIVPYEVLHHALNGRRFRGIVMARAHAQG